MKILVTGFEPFGGSDVNPSWMSVETLPDSIGEAQIIKKQLPVVYFRALEVLEGYIKEYQPDYILMAGQTIGCNWLRIERVGINLCEGSIADNAGVTLADTPIVEGGPNAYFSTFPYREMLAEVTAAGIPARFSFSAGTYLCNHVLYGALHMAKERYPNIKAGFIHVPSLPEQVKEGELCMDIETIRAGMKIFAETLCKN